jgi:hypothetical protein
MFGSLLQAYTFGGVISINRPIPFSRYVERITWHGDRHKLTRLIFRHSSERWNSKKNDQYDNGKIHKNPLLNGAIQKKMERAAGLEICSGVVEN